MFSCIVCVSEVLSAAFLQEEVEPQPAEENNPYEEVYKDSSTFLKVRILDPLSVL